MNILVNTKNIISISEARSRIMSISSDTINRAPFLITKNGKPDFYLLPQEDLDNWLETQQVLRENPNILKDIENSRKEFLNNETISLESAIKNRTKYVQSRIIKKSK